MSKEPRSKTSIPLDKALEILMRQEPPPRTDTPPPELSAAQVEHTPTPWTAEKGGKGAWIKGANGEWAALSCGDTDATADANAAFILEAVNTFATRPSAPADALVEALRRFEPELSDEQRAALNGPSVVTLSREDVFLLGWKAIRSLFIAAHTASSTGAGGRETQQSINEWIEATFGAAGSNLSVVTRANEEMAELLMALAVDDNHADAVEEAADIVIILYRLAQRHKRDLLAEVDRKMSVNRARKWNVANGHGYHVPAAPADQGSDAGRPVPHHGSGPISRDG